MGWGLIGDGMGWGPEVTRELVQDEGVIHGVGRDAGVGHTARGGRRGCPGVTGAAMAQPPPPPPNPPNMAAAPLPSAPQRPPARGKRRTVGRLHFRDGRRAACAATANQRSARAAVARNSNVVRALPGAGFWGSPICGSASRSFPFSVTNGGKTTLTNRIVKALPNCCVIHQDDFFKVGAAGTPTCGGVCVGGASAAPRSGSREIPLLLPSGVLQCDTCIGGNAALGAVEYGARGALGLMDH